jgi:heme/copper-type cytochrome/quinol oxidase subunit 3
MLERARLGMAMFLLNQAMLFLFLIIGFVYFQKPGGHVDVTLGAGGLYTVSLAASSITMWRATVSNARRWLAATIILGCAFLWGEYRSVVPVRDLVPPFFTLAGCHQLHVVVGILLVGIALWDERRSVIVRTVALYWYFVTAVWIAIVAVGFIV